MSGFFSRLFGRKPALTQRLDEEIGRIQQTEGGRVGLLVYAIIQPQLEMLGYPEGVPPEAEYITSQCRGCLWGQAFGILRLSGQDATAESLADVVSAVFGMTYGEVHGFDLAEQTRDDLLAKNPEASVAADWAADEVLNVHGGQGNGNTVMGFYMASRGLLNI